jgi:hypothetical protein
MNKGKRNVEGGIEKQLPLFSSFPLPPSLFARREGKGKVV